MEEVAFLVDFPSSVVLIFLIVMIFIERCGVRLEGHGKGVLHTACPVLLMDMEYAGRVG